VLKPIAIIPARGGSKRVLKKNSRLINGKSLVGHAIDQCQKSELFSKIYVNSDDAEILNIATQEGASPFLRPKILGSDEVLIIDVLKQMTNELGLNEELPIGVLLATNPLRLPSDLQNAYQIFLKNKGLCNVVSVGTFETPIHLALSKDLSGKLSPAFPEKYQITTRSQNHQTYYKFNGAVLFSTVNMIKKQHNLIGDFPLAFEMPLERSIDIDHEYQFQFVKYLLENKG
jgi:CMP-N,N'-diacetyllegionaminic acid synthase